MLRSRSGIWWLLASLLAVLAASPAGAQPPTNDFFVVAKTIGSLPYHDAPEVGLASIESGEPFYCAFSNQTVWYKFTPSARTWVRAAAQMTSNPSRITIYRSYGPGIYYLSYVACAYDSAFVSSLIFIADPGVTYYFQVSPDCCSIPGYLQFDVTETPPPPPVASFYFYPSDPSVYDNIQFQDNSYDPAGVGIVSWSWDFGDGSVATGCCPTHQYAEDGGYDIKLTISTSDNRLATITQRDSVRTRDVGITGFKTPQTASAGQTKPITVSIVNPRYPELIHVTLEKSTIGGFNYVGSQDQYLPVKKQPTDVVFSYVFTSQDAQVGKVTFRATVSFFYGRDALPGDNQVVSLPTKLNKFETIADEGGDLHAGQDMALAIDGVFPNPASVGTDLAVKLALPVSGPARLQVIDIAGRVWAEKDLGDAGAGAHDVRLAWGQRPTPGIYWVRLIQQGASVSRRIALIQ